MAGSETLRLLSTTQAIQEFKSGALILDVRPAEQFAAFLVAEDAGSAQEAHNRLTRVGLGRVIGYTLATEKQWRDAGIELGNVSTARCANLGSDLQRDSSLQLVDVRSRAEWLKGHLPGAISTPLLDLDTKARSIDPSRPSLVYCHEGYRATTARPASCFGKAPATSAF